MVSAWVSHALKSWVRARVSAEKVPVTITFVDEIPKTASGKKARFLTASGGPERCEEAE